MKTYIHSHFYVVVLVLFVCSLVSVAQVATGTPPFGSFTGGPDVINLGNLNAHLAIPVINKPGRGLPFNYTLSYDSSVWSPVGASGSQNWQPATNWGWRGQTEAETGYLSFYSSSARCPNTTISQGLFYFQYRFFSYHDTFGIAHPFTGSAYDYTECPSGSSSALNATSSDGSGYQLSYDPVAGTQSLTTRSGESLNVPDNSTAGAGTVTDRNGNQVSTTGNGIFTDTLGMTALTITGGAPNPLVFTYTSTVGPAAVTMNYSSVTVQTNFSCSGIANYGPTTVSLVSSIKLPDNSTYSFTYEPTPGYPGSYTGRVQTITLPTGGTITYSYTGANNGINCTDGSTLGLTRQTSDGTTTYSRSGSGTAWTTVVTDAATPGNQTQISFQTAGLSGSPQNFYETQRKSYQGSTTGTLLARSDRCYNGASYSATSDCTGTAITLPISEIRSYATLGSVTNLT